MQEIEQLGFDRPTMFDYYTTARQLERVADHAEKIAATVLRLDDPSAVNSLDELVSLAHQSREIVVDAASVLLGMERLSKRTQRSPNAMSYSKQSSLLTAHFTTVRLLTRISWYSSSIACVEQQSMAATLLKR